MPFGLNTRQMNAWMIQGEGLALTRVLFDKYNILTLPVVEENRVLAGVITADDIISVLRQK